LRGASWSTRVPGQPLFLQDLNCHCFDPSITQVLNPLAWTDSPSGTFSPSAAYYNDFRYQRRPSELASLGRTFHIKEHVSFEVRAEFNNVFNRALFLDPTATAAGTYIRPSTLRNAALTRGPDGRYVSGFGTINTTGTIGGERQGTLVARIRF